MVEIDDPFADWKRLLNKSVYSIDGKKIGFLRKVVADYMIVKKGVCQLDKIFHPCIFSRIGEQNGDKGSSYCS